jgi:hypothetical protein
MSFLLSPKFSLQTKSEKKRVEQFLPGSRILGRWEVEER